MSASHGLWRCIVGLVVALASPCAAVRAQKIEEFQLAPGSGPEGLAWGPDGNLWFSEETGNRIGRLTSSGSLSDFPLANPGSRPRGVAATPDGVVFTEQAGRIGSITPSALISEFPTPGSRPVEIAPGPFAQLWWSDSARDFLGTTDGRGGGFGSFQLSPGSRPEGLATGSGGDLWIAENGSGRLAFLHYEPRPPGIPGIGSVQSREFALPDPQSGPWTLCYGPDGNVWFTEAAAGKIGRVSPQGEIVEFALPPGAEPRGIVAGPDFNLWFTDAGRDLLARSTPAGAMTEFPIPERGGRPTRIVAGGDGNLWFTEPGRDAIGRLTVPAFCAAGSGVLCLNGGRFQAAVAWSFSNGPAGGLGNAVPLTGETGAFWFFTSNNIELVVKVVDGRPLNGKFWVFAAGLTDGQWVLTVRDTQTGAIRTYQNAEGTLRSLADTNAFPDPGPSSGSAARAR